MTEYDLGKVVGEDGQKGDDGSTLWYTSTAPTYANSKYTFTISNLSGKSGLEVAVNDIIFYSTYYYVVSAVNSTTVDCSTRVNIKGSDASVTIQTSWGSTTSDSKVPSEKLTKTALDGKSNTGHTHTKSEVTDFPTLSTVATSGSYNDLSNKPTIPSASSTTPSADVSGGSVGTGTTWAKADHQHPLSTAYATSGHTHGNLQSDGSVGTSNNASKNVVTDSNGKITTEAKPTIPSKTSDLTNDGADGTNIFVANNDSRLSDARTPSSHTHGQITNAGAITSTAVTVASGDNIVITDASDSSKVKRVANILADHVKDGTAHANIGSSANDSQATINTDINTALGNKQATLVSGSNIKTVNNESLLGSGNITIQGGSTVDIVTSWNSTTSDSKVPSEKLTKTSLDDKISKSNTSGLVKNDGTIDTTSYSTFSGSYSDLSNKPSIPASSSDLSDGSDLVKTSNTSGLIKNDGSIMTSGTGSSNWAVGNHTHSGYVSATKVTSWSGTVSDSNVPSEKLTKDSLDGKVNTSDIADNLTTNDATKVLSAKQGKVLNDLIGSAITYIVGSGS